MAENGDAVIIDGVDGKVHLRPQSDVELAYAEKVRFRAKRQELYRELRDLPSHSKDGLKVDLLMNAGLMVDLPQLEESGAAGIGLFRTELQFMVASAFPRAEAQEELYRTCWMLRANCRSPSAPSISAATRHCLTSGMFRQRKIRPWAGGPSACRSTGRACCAPSCARF